jgi:hypothetical protein
VKLGELTSARGVKGRIGRGRPTVPGEAYDKLTKGEGGLAQTARGPQCPGEPRPQRWMDGAEVR